MARNSLAKMWLLIYGPQVFIALFWNIGWLMFALWLVTVASHPHLAVTRFFLLLPSALILWLVVRPSR